MDQLLLEIYNKVITCVHRKSSCATVCPFKNGVKIGHLYGCREITVSHDFKAISPDWYNDSHTRIEKACRFLKIGWNCRTRYCIQGQLGGRLMMPQTLAERIMLL